MKHTLTGIALLLCTAVSAAHAENFVEIQPTLETCVGDPRENPRPCSSSSDLVLDGISNLTEEELEELKALGLLMTPIRGVALTKHFLNAYIELRTSPIEAVPLEIAIIEATQ